MTLIIKKSLSVKCPIHVVSVLEIVEFTTYTQPFILQPLTDKLNLCNNIVREYIFLNQISIG